MAQRSNPTLATVTWLSAGLLLATAAAVLTGWMLNIGILKTVLPGLTTMKANTALALGATGCGLAGLRIGGARGRGAVLMAAALVGVLGGATLLEYLGHVSFGIDELVFKDPDTTSRPFNGRMSPASALSFVAIGSGLALAAQARSRAVVMLSHATAAIPAFIGSMCLAAYLYGVSGLYAFGPYLTVALHTAAGLTIAAAGLLSVRPREGWASAYAREPIASSALWKLGSLAIFAPFATGALVVQGVRAGYYQPMFAPAVFATASAGAFMTLAFASAAVLARAERAVRRSQTEVEAAAVRLALSEERRLALVENLPQLVWTCLPNGACNYLGPQWMSYTGRPEAEQLGDGWLAMVHPDDAARSFEHWRGAVLASTLTTSSIAFVAMAAPTAGSRCEARLSVT